MPDNEKKPTILVIDDMPINIKIVANALNQMYKLKIATNGRKGLEIAISDDPPDLILLDIVMPGMDGYEVLQKLKDEPRTKHIPVIFLTVKDDMHDETTGFERGAVDYITKPFQVPIMKARIKTQLDLKMAHEERLKKEKLMSVLEMAGAACHEITQPLQAISNYSEMLTIQVKDDNPLHKTAGKIANQVKKLAAITNKIRNITKYETKDYLTGKIIDIDKAADS